MTDALNDLRCEVLRSATVRVGLRSSLVHEALLRETEVSDLDVALVVEEHVLRLQVTVDNAVLVQAAEAFDKLSCVEACAPFTEFLVFPQVVEQFTTVEEIHYEVELRRRLEGVVQLDNKRAIDLL